MGYRLSGTLTRLPSHVFPVTPFSLFRRVKNDPPTAGNLLQLDHVDRKTRPTGLVLYLWVVASL